MDMFQQTVSDGADFNQSDAYLINGQPGALYNCSAAGKMRCHLQATLWMTDYNVYNLFFVQTLPGFSSRKAKPTCFGFSMQQ